MPVPDLTTLGSNVEILWCANEFPFGLVGSPTCGRGVAMRGGEAGDPSDGRQN
jgi:hypothetical protein